MTLEFNTVSSMFGQERGIKNGLGSTPDSFGSVKIFADLQYLVKIAILLTYILVESVTKLIIRHATSLNDKVKFIDQRHGRVNL